MRNIIAQHWPAAATADHRYSDQSALNLLAHISFVFGILPAYAYATPLPDWSIGLEMEFYAAFPFLMLLMLRIGPLKAALACGLACLALKAVVPEFFHAFAMPSLLPEKLYLFLSGMLIAVGRWQKRLLPCMVLSLMLCLPFLSWHDTESLLTLALLPFIYYLLSDGSLPGGRGIDCGLTVLRRVLGGPMGRLLGNASYCVYLLHLLVLIPVAAMLAQQPWYLALNAQMRFCCCLVMVLPMVYGLAICFEYIIEQPGIRMGRRLTSYRKNAACL